MDKIINFCARLLSANSNYNEEIMAFCIKLWLSTIAQTLFLFILSIIFFDLKIFFAFAIVFCTLRAIIEGYHCKTFISCFLLTDLMFFAVVGAGYIAAKISSLYIFGVVLLNAALLGLLYECKKAFSRANIRLTIYGYLRFVIVVLMWLFIMYQLYVGKTDNFAVWVMCYSYSLVYILVVVEKINRYISNL